MIYQTIPLLILMFPTIFSFLARTLIWYHIYVAFKIAISILFKLRYQVYNSDLKLARVDDQAIFITGATSGIGLALAKYFYRKGYKVIVGYLTKEEPGFSVLETISATSGQKDSLFFVEVNVNSVDSITNAREAIQQLMKKHKFKLHALVNNAGVIDFNPAQWVPPENIQNIVQTNLIGPMLVVRLLLPLLINVPDSRIINVSSGLAMWSSSCCGIYGATKAGLAYYTNCLQFDIARYGVKAVTIYPSNLIRNTGIMRDCAQHNLKVVNSLSEFEKEIYKDDINVHLQTVQQTQNNIRDYQDRYKYQFYGSEKGIVKKNFLKKAYALISGTIEDNTGIEDSRLIDSFDNAVTLADPPGEMFAGNIFFQIVVASFMEQVSQSTRLLMGLAAKRVGLDILSFQDY